LILITNFFFFDKIEVVLAQGKIAHAMLTVDVVLREYVKTWQQKMF
jgi:hypothetical protein